ncbi:hypothetical protein PVAND_001502 [Polypedilum vanderplanki]|uniref:BTB domain-containing protein n=1 Tax=Polypedilum vanderplanki TaxID=319348 RepID=A0A9J6BN48_POLVA|nr:hypothetical protein PVAND_001502 [Polypedilum vanderplanki]
MEISNSWKRTICLNFEDIYSSFSDLPDQSTFSKVFVLTIGLEQLKMLIAGCVCKTKNRYDRNQMYITLTYMNNPIYLVDKIILLNYYELKKTQNGTETAWKYTLDIGFNTLDRHYLQFEISGKIISEKPFPLTKQYSDFYLKDLLSDIKIISRDEISFPAHRVILSNHSSIFNKMFTSVMIEARSNKINIEDADGDAIKEFLRFIYLGEIEDKKQLLPIFYLAEKYDLSALKSYCAYLSLNHVNYDNVLGLIDLADRCNENLMFYNCVKFITAHLEEVTNLKGWKSLNNSVMTKIMKNIIVIEMKVDKESMEKINVAFSDVIREFYIAQNIKFDFIIYGETSYHLNDLIDGIAKHLNEEIPINIKNYPNWNFITNKSVIIFVKLIKDFKKLHRSAFKNYDNLQLTNDFYENFKFLVYVEEIKTLKELQNSLEEFEIVNFAYPADLKYFEFFITSDENFLHLSANLLYSENNCRFLEQKLLNSFNKKSKTWNKKLKNFDQYNNFHGCLLEIFVPHSYSFYPKMHSESFDVQTLASNDIKFHGLINEVVEIMSKRNNYSFHYTIFDFLNSQERLFPTRNFEIFPGYGIMIETKNINRENKRIYLEPHDDTEFYFLVSYNDLYNNYEKLVFPFDATTWILIFFTFGLTFGVIFGLKHSPQSIRTIIFGRGINNPGYNALAIFMGISQLRLPTESFCRFILLMYISFCLIIRTCWQSKMFEFMTTDMRKPLPENFEDLREMNYTILADMMYKNIIEEMISGRERPRIQFVQGREFVVTYELVINQKINTKFAFFVKKQNHIFFNSTFKNSLPTMQNEKLTKMIAFSSYGNNVLMSQIKEVINKLIPSGIPKHLNDYGLWYLFRPVDVEIEDPRRVLSMSDLEFGFVIFLVALAFSIVVFLCEIVSLSVKRRLRKLIGLYEFVRIIRERLKDYHDKW